MSPCTLLSALACGAVLFWITGCGGADAGGGPDPGTNTGTGDQATLVMPGARLSVQRQASGAGSISLALSSLDAANIANLVVLGGADWEGATAGTVTLQGDGSWLATVPTAPGAKILFRMVLADGNTVESSVDPASL